MLKIILAWVQKKRLHVGICVQRRSYFQKSFNLYSNLFTTDCMDNLLNNHSPFSPTVYESLKNLESNYISWGIFDSKAENLYLLECTAREVYDLSHISKDLTHEDLYFNLQNICAKL